MGIEPLRVFLSHTSELRQFPQDRSFVTAAEQAVSRANGTIIDMAYFPAAASAPAALCRDRLGQANVYVGILGFRYGSPVADEPAVSYTELEFATATELGMPRLILLLDENAVLPLPRGYLSDPRYEDRQTAFRQRAATAGVTVQRVNSPEQLELVLFHALAELRRGPASGPATDPADGRPVPRQLPGDTAHFVGRSAELAILSSLLDGDADAGSPAAPTATTPPGPPAVLSISGMGGIGKTALALRWAREHAAEHPDGQLWVNLRGYDPAADPVSPDTALHGFLTALGVAPSTVPDGLDARAGLYRSLLTGRRVLVVLDNARETAQVAPLLPATADSTVLVTSRRQLTGLVMAHGARTVRLDVLSEPEARRLLSSFIGAGRIAAEPEAVTALVACCEGLPLALSVVAARAAIRPDFPLAELAAELAETATRLDMLNGDDVSANVQAVLSWSHRTLSADAATLLGLLGLAPGPDIGRAAAVSLAGWPDARTRTALRELDTASLAAEYLPGRYRMHDLVRLFAANQARCELTPEARRAALRRVTDYYLHTAFTGDRVLVPARQPIAVLPQADGSNPGSLADRATALAWFETEHPCLLAAQQLAVSQGWHAHTWQLAWGLNSYHNIRGLLTDQLGAWHAGAHAADQLTEPAASALAHRALGSACVRAGRHTEAVEHLRHGIAIAESAGELNEQAFGHRTLARAWALRGRHDKALGHANSALRLLRVLGNPLWEAEALNEAGLCHAHLDDPDQARASCEAALELQREHGDLEGEGYTLDNFGFLALRADRPGEAVEHYVKAVERWQQLGHAYNEAASVDGLGQAHAALGHHDEARRCLLAALDSYQAQHRNAESARVLERLDALDRPTPSQA
jgi:tetratricopeptide (TPR) repeat protein